jgi:MSHA biogenesis protein MshJ
MAASPLAKRYESLSLRERAMVALAILGAAIFLWDKLFMDQLRNTKMALGAELSAASASGVVAQSADVSDPRQMNLQRAGQLQTQMQELDARITDTASGFVSAPRMIQVLNDVLDRQGRLELVSIRNLPVESLVPPSKDAANPTDGPPADDSAEPALGPPPYVHSIVIVIDGQYADILEYLEALEKLPYKFRWGSMDLNARGYPRNRVRIQLSTLSLDSTWLGVKS